MVMHHVPPIYFHFFSFSKLLFHFHLRFNNGVVICLLVLKRNSNTYAVSLHNLYSLTFTYFRNKRLGEFLMDFYLIESLGSVVNYNIVYRDFDLILKNIFLTVLLRMNSW